MPTLPTERSKTAPTFTEAASSAYSVAPPTTTAEQSSEQNPQPCTTSVGKGMAN